MKKLFTIDDLFIALVAAVGYGFTFEIPKILGYPEWLSIASCLIVGMILEGLIYKVVFSKIVQGKPAYRFTALAVLVIIFLLLYIPSRRWAFQCSIILMNSSNLSLFLRY